MGMARSSGAVSKTVVAVLTADPAFEQQMRSIFGTSGQIELRVIPGTVETAPDIATEGVTVVIVDLDAGRPEVMAALERMMLRVGALPPVVVVTQSFDAEVARSLLQMRVADFLVKPVQPIELVRTCARVARSTVAETKEAQIYTFIPAVGGAGVTTLGDPDSAAAAQQRPARRARHSTCLVDLDFQHGACADYLDLEPRLDLKEIEPRPERLDRQLLEIMLSHHASGLEVIAAPNRPAEMRSFDPGHGDAIA